MVKRVLYLEIRNCFECPYCDYNPDYGMSYDSGYDCTSSVRKRLIDDWEWSNQNNKDRLNLKMDCFPTPEWCPLKPIKEIKPIKVLFSGKEIVDKGLNEKFVKISKDINSNKNINTDVKNFFNKNKEKRSKNKTMLGGQNNFLFEKKWSEQKFDAVFIIDDKANILDCNKNMSTLLGYTKSEIK